MHMHMHLPCAFGQAGQVSPHFFLINGTHPKQDADKPNACAALGSSLTRLLARTAGVDLALTVHHHHDHYYEHYHNHYHYHNHRYKRGHLPASNVCVCGGWGLDGGTHIRISCLTHTHTLLPHALRAHAYLPHT